MFGIDLATATFMSAGLIALFAGVLSFLSPCVLPIVPPYLAYMTGVNMNGLKQRERSAFVPALFFVMGLSTVFLIMGFAASTFGRMFLQYQGYLAQAAGVMIVIMGLHFLHVFRIPILDQEARLQAGKTDGGAFGAYILGLAFAFGWTPCIGPQLGMILSLAATGGEVSRGTGLLALYAIGLGIPFILAAIFVNRAISVMNRIKPWMKTIERVMGLLLVIVGVMLVTGAFSAFAFWLLETFPVLATLG